MGTHFENEAEWVSSALLSARLEHAALLRLLLKKKILQPEELLSELSALASDEYVFNLKQFVAQSETQLRNGRWHIGGAKATDQLGRRLALGPDDSVLDIGCGIGGPARQIAETFGSSVVGVDHRFDRILEAMLRTAVLGMNLRISFHVADGEHLPFEEETFEAVVSQATLNWIPDKPAAIREAFRALKPRGRFGFECEAMTEKAITLRHEEPTGLFRILGWQQLLAVAGFAEVEIEEMWDESRLFYPTGPEREQMDQGERVNVRMMARKP